MAAPSPTTRVEPTGKKFEDGYRTLITFSLDTNIELWEIEVTPPGRDGGEPIPTTTMWNDDYETVRPRALIKSTDGQVTCAYQEATIGQLDAIINREGTITLTFPDESTEAFFGFPKSYTRSPMKHGEMPTMTVTFVETDFDPANDVEAGPATAAVAGT